MCCVSRLHDRAFEWVVCVYMSLGFTPPHTHMCLYTNRQILRLTPLYTQPAIHSHLSASHIRHSQPHTSHTLLVAMLWPSTVCRHVCVCIQTTHSSASAYVCVCIVWGVCILLMCVCVVPRQPKEQHLTAYTSSQGICLGTVLVLNRKKRPVRFTAYTHTQIYLCTGVCACLLRVWLLFAIWKSHQSYRNTMVLPNSVDIYV